MSNHPNRGAPKAASSPHPQDILARRQMAALTKAEAAAMVYVGATKWHAWEAGKERMHPAMWELFKRKTDELPMPPGF